MQIPDIISTEYIENLGGYISSLGPRYGSQKNYIFPKTLLDFIIKCTNYVSSLSSFGQYCIWRYTIGSASINKYLIFNGIGGPSGSDTTTIGNAIYWTQLFFKYYNNTFGRGLHPRGLAWMKYRAYFDDPTKYNFLDNKIKADIAKDVIKKYIVELTKIIKGAPVVGKGGITVYKIASKYPDLPGVGSEFNPKLVKQMPFNSTTISPYFNFAPFISSEADCCLFEIHIPEGYKGCMYVPAEFHAYPFEQEIILPPGVSFDIFKEGNVEFQYIDSSIVNMDLLQDKPSIVIGPVYNINEYQPCKSGACGVSTKIFHLFECDLV